MAANRSEMECDSLFYCSQSEVKSKVGIFHTSRSRCGRNYGETCKPIQ